MKKNFCIFVLICLAMPFYAYRLSTSRQYKTTTVDFYWNTLYSTGPIDPYEYAKSIHNDYWKFVNTTVFFIDPKKTNANNPIDYAQIILDAGYDGKYYLSVWNKLYDKKWMIYSEDFTSYSEALKVYQEWVVLYNIFVSYEH